MSDTTKEPLNVGIVGAGLGGLAAAIAIAQAGCRVTVLEAAKELGEIGAGIQMFGNVSRFLIRTGVDEIIGDNLVQIDEVRTWAHSENEAENGQLIGRVDAHRVVKILGFPWWVVRRDHLHMGLAEGARRNGVTMITNFRVVKLEEHGRGAGATITSEAGASHRFDLVVGADGIKSAVRNFVFPDMQPHSASNIAAYRALVPYEDVFKHIPEARSKLGNTMDTWPGPGGYVLLYPLSAGKELNVVTAYEQLRPVTQLEDVSIEEFRDHYKGWDPFIVKILQLVKETKRWPLNIIPPAKSWSNGDKNIILMGDAAHGMQNHLAQGAATAMEDGIFLGRVLGEVMRNVIDLETAIHLYEKKRIPRAWHKQQTAFTQGEMLIVKGKEKAMRDSSTLAEVRAWDRNPVHPEILPPTFRTYFLWSKPEVVPSIHYYDAEGDADFAVDEWLMDQNDVDPKTLVSRGLRHKRWSALSDNGLDRWERALKPKSKL